MNLYHLKQILAQSKHPSAPQMYGEVSDLINHFVNNDGDPENATIVESFALFILLNETTYNIYGRLRRKNQESLDHFVEQVRFYLSACLTEAQIKDAYDAICDLWEDNEREDYNRPDGGFWGTQSALINSLYTTLLELEGDRDSLNEKLKTILSHYCYEELNNIIKEVKYD